MISRVVSWLDPVFPRGLLLLLEGQECWGLLAVGSPLPAPLGYDVCGGEGGFALRMGVGWKFSRQWSREGGGDIIIYVFFLKRSHSCDSSFKWFELQCGKVDGCKCL